MHGHRQELVRFLVEHAYKEIDVVLSSGAASPFYIDAKKVTHLPRAVEAVGQAVFERIRKHKVVGVGGLTMGADAIVTSTIWAALKHGVQLPGFVVRKAPKEHGLEQEIEGVVPPRGSRVAIVDDVVTSGKSVFKAIAAAEEKEWEVVVVVPLVDREQGCAESVRARGIAYEPVCTLSDIRAALPALGAGR